MIDIKYHRNLLFQFYYNIYMLLFDMAADE